MTTCTHRTHISLPEQSIGDIEQKLRLFDHDGRVTAEATETCPDQGYACYHCSSSESCEYRTIADRINLLNNASIPSRFINATMDSVRQNMQLTSSIIKVVTWLDKWCLQDPLPKKAMLLSGPHGTGKSFVMAALCRWLTLKRGISCLFVDFGLFLMQLKARYGTGKNDYELFKNLFNAAILVLDDVGSSRDSEWSKEVFRTIIARRYNDCSRTFLTTNLSVNTNAKKPENEFLQWSGSHSGSRLKEMCYWLPFNCVDRRIAENR